jgi:MoaA/NifB/PqqE/SkfB family radical SAM enzyme
MQTVEIEATNLCNTRCLHCPHESITRPKGMMSWDRFQIIAEKVLDYGLTQTVSFSGMGEPTLNPDLPKFIRFFKGRLVTFVTTNASTLTPQNVERLIEAGLGMFVVSFNGADAATYESMMGRLSFQRAQESLRGLVTRAKGLVRILANVTITQQTQPHLAEIKRYLESLGVDEIIFSKCHSRGGHLKNPAVCTTPLPPVAHQRCDIFDDTLFVSWDGHVLSCCQDLDGHGRLGNLLTDRLPEIHQIKKALWGKGAMFPMCSACNDLHRFSQDETPDGRSLSSWIYDLYSAESDPLARLARLLDQRERQIRQLEQRAQEAEAKVAALERLPLVRFIRETKKWLRSFRFLRRAR